MVMASRNIVTFTSFDQSLQLPSGQSCLLFINSDSTRSSFFDPMLSKIDRTRFLQCCFFFSLVPKLFNKRKSGNFLFLTGGSGCT